MESNLTKEFPTGISPYADGERNLQTEDFHMFFKFNEDGVKLSSFCN